jgi:predicted Zn-dependent protease with MMP-like domain
MVDVDLSNPDFEPTDEELQGLATRAFRDVPRKNAKMLEEVRQRIQQYAAAAAAGAVANKP